MAALDVLGSADHLPPVLSGRNAYWMWPGRASDQTVLVVEAPGRLRPYSAKDRLLTIDHGPYQVQNGRTPSRSASAPGLRPAGTRYGPG